MEFIWNHKIHRISKAILRKKTKQKVQPIYTTKYKSSVHTTILQSYTNQDIMVQAQNQHMNQWNRIEKPEINLCTQSQLNLDNIGTNKQWRKDSFFNKQCWESQIAAYKSMKSEHTVTSYTKINSKELNHLNIRHDTMKLLQNIGKIFYDVIIPMFSQVSLPRQRK